MQEKQRDWLFRYQYIYRVRSNEKSKQRFLKALVADLLAIREDITVRLFVLTTIHRLKVSVLMSFLIVRYKKDKH